MQNGSLSVGDVTIELDKIDSESGVKEVDLYEITGMLCFVYIHILCILVQIPTLVYHTYLATGYYY